MFYRKLVFKKSNVSLLILMKLTKSFLNVAEVGVTKSSFKFL